MAKKKVKKEVVEVEVKTTDTNEKNVETFEQDNETVQVPFVQEVSESVYSPVEISHFETTEEPEDGVATYAALSTEEDSTQETETKTNEVKQPKISVKPKKKITPNPIFGDFTYTCESFNG